MCGWRAASWRTAPSRSPMTWRVCLARGDRVRAARVGPGRAADGRDGRLCTAGAAALLARPRLDHGAVGGRGALGVATTRGLAACAPGRPADRAGGQL